MQQVRPWLLQVVFAHRWCMLASGARLSACMHACMVAWALAGRTGGAATALLVLNAIFNTLWWLMVVWLVLLCMGCSVWAVMLDVSRKACSAAIASVKKYPPAPWSPSSGKPCPGRRQRGAACCAGVPG